MSSKVDYKTIIPSAGQDACPPGADLGGGKGKMEVVINIEYDPLTQEWDLGRHDATGERAHLTYGVGVGALSRALVEITLGSRVDSINSVWEAFTGWGVSPAIRTDQSE